MYNFIRQDYNINEESLLIIGLGDSFTEGQGALSDKTWAKYNYSTWERGQDLRKNEILEELENSWVYKICKNHFPQYTPINFGFRGKGNKNAFKNLTTLNPELNIPIAKDIIVVAFLTDMVRYDYINDPYINRDRHNYYTAMWPHNPEENMKDWKKKLWEGYRDGLWSDLFGVVEFLINLQDLKNWCKLYGAKLLITSAFSPEYTEDYFKFHLKSSSYTPLLDIIDWKKDFYYPDGYNCFTDVLCKKEGWEKWIGTRNWYAETQEKFGSPGGWFTPCAHPSVKGHELIANYLAKEIESRFGVLEGPKSILKHSKQLI